MNTLDYNADEYDSTDDYGKDGSEMPLSPQPSTSQQSDNILCCVCYESIPNVVLLPCRHLKTCTDCWNQIVARNVANNENDNDDSDDDDENKVLRCAYCTMGVENTIEVFS